MSFWLLFTYTDPIDNASAFWPCNTSAINTDTGNDFLDKHISIK